MKKFKKMMGFAIVFIAFAASVTAFANSTDYKFNHYSALFL